MPEPIRTRPASNHPSDLLSVLPESNDGGPHWFLATVVTKARSSYRQPGALMLISPEGEKFGLVSGGCLEADIQRRARQLSDARTAVCVTYDSSDEDNIAFELGLGCNGRVDVLIQRLDHGELAALRHLQQRLAAGEAAWLASCWSGDDIGALAVLDDSGESLSCSRDAVTPPEPSAAEGIDNPHRVAADAAGNHWSLNRLRPPTQLLVLGGGIDAPPLCALALTLGWRVTVLDPRPSHARAEHFPRTVRLGRELAIDAAVQRADAVVVMGHNLELDSGWLGQLAALDYRGYIGLLGPVQRRDDVLTRAGIGRDTAFARSISGPMGIDIGGDTPEAVALSVLAEIHRQLFRCNDRDPA